MKFYEIRRPDIDQSSTQWELRRKCGDFGLCIELYVFLKGTFPFLSHLAGQLFQELNETEGEDEDKC